MSCRSVVVGSPFKDESGSPNVVHLPSFKLSAQQEKGHVEVIIEDPKGKIIKPNIKATNGLYNATFLPEKPGDYLVSIRAGCDDIEGSPFYVKVFDPSKIKVSGIKAGFVMQPSVFLVDTEGLGDGPLVITITNLKKNTVIPAKVVQDSARPHMYQVQWIPPVFGFYRIQIQFANVEAPGSPFAVEVIDPSSTAVTGLGGNSLIPIGRIFAFGILTQSSSVSLQNLKIQISDEKGMTVSPRLLDKGKGSAGVEFTPVAVGTYKIEVSYFGQPIKGSPFVIRTFDASRVKILNWKTIGKIGKEVDFEVDISKAGPGDLDISVAGGDAPYKVQQKEPGKYRVVFVPKQAGVLNFNFKFNKVTIVGGPWICTVQSPPTVQVSGAGVESNVPIPVNVPTSFQVKITGPSNEDIAVNITDPSGGHVPAQMVNSKNSMFTYQYIPVLAGTHTIEVSLDGSSVGGSPFTVKAYSPGSVIIGDVQTGIVGLTSEFQVDTTHAGDGQLEVLVDNGSIPCNVFQTSKGRFNVSFVPKEARVHQIVVKFNGQQVKGSPISVNVLDLSRISVGSDYKFPLQKPYSVRLNIAGAGTGKYTAIVRAPSGAEMVPTLKELNKRFLDIEGTPREVGIHEVEVYLDGFALPINPIHVSIYDGSKIKVRDIKNGFVQKQMKIIVESGDPGDGDLKFSVLGPNGSALNNLIEQNTPNSYSLAFTPLMQGPHQLIVTFNDEPIPGSPYSFMVYNIDGISVSGKALDGFPCTKPAWLLLTSPDGLQSSNCEVKVTDPAMRIVPVRLSDVSEGTVRVEFTGSSPGDYKVDVKCFGQTIPQSPFILKGYDVSKVNVSPISTGVVGVQAAFNINLRDAGEGTLEIGITGPQGQQVVNNVSPMGPGQFVVNFTPLVQGPHTANINFNDEPVKGSPFTIMVNDPSKICARGEGLDLIKCNKPTSFLITSAGVSECDLNVRITGPKNSDVRYRMGEQGPGVYKVDYTPTIPGDYVIEIEAYKKPINYSPFAAKCWDSSKVTTTKISTGRVGVQSSFNIDASMAGEGSMEIVVTGPSGQSVPNNVVPLGPGLFIISFTPTECGVHKATVTFNQENVIGSPFLFNVTDLARASARGDGLGLVKVNSNASFTITAPGAQEKDVEVYVYAPNGKEVAHRMTEISPNNFKVDFTPTMAGAHRIDVNYFGSALPGSPFVSKVWDSSKVVVSNVRNGRVGATNVFNVDANEAGEGTMEIGVTSPSGQNIHNNVVSTRTGQFEVSSVPEEAGPYKVTVTFNKENVPGSPFTFMATDASKVTARGDGLGTVRCGTPTSFTVFAPAAQMKDLDISVAGPDNNELVTRITETSPNTFRVEYTPAVVGTHYARVLYFGQAVPSSPFPIKVWDPSSARISVPPFCKVGKQSSIQVNAKGSGEGLPEITIIQPSGRPLPSNISPLGNGIYDVAFVTMEPGTHKVSASFNGENISGSPTTFISIDPSKVNVRGDGLGVVPCSVPATFNFKAPAASSRDVLVKIIGPDYRDVNYRIVETGDGFNVEYTPQKPGDYTIEVSYFGEPVSGSPFTSKAFDSSMVHVNPINSAILSSTTHFTVNTSQAGVGPLEVLVSAGGATVPAIIKGLGNGMFDVAFTPQVADVHDVSIKFNGREVPGSPFQVYVVDGSKAIASGPGLELARVNSLASFDVVTNNPASKGSSLEVSITNPRGQIVSSQVTPTGSNGYRVDYTPREPGQHRVTVKYAGVGIQGSPFSVPVFDPSLVRLGQVSQGIIGKPVSFEVDATRSGILDGTLTVDIRGQRTKPIPQITSSQGLYHVTFVASESVPHTINLTYAGERVIGSPLTMNFVDPQNMHIKWNSSCYIPVNSTATFELEMGDNNVAALNSAPGSDDTVECKVKDSAGRNVTCHIKRDAKSYKMEFVPTSVGPHLIDVYFGNVRVPGTPHTCFAYDASRVSVNNISHQNQVGKEAGFDVDTSRAGQGEVKVTVESSGAEILTHARQISEHVTRYTFVPVNDQPHVATVRFNNSNVPGSPITFQVMNPANQLMLIPLSGSGVIAVGQPINSLLKCGGLSLNLSDIKAEAKSLKGELQNVSTSMDLDGSIKFTYIAKTAGTYKLDVSYAGRPVPGSPLLTEVFDPSKVVVQAPTTGIVGHPLSADISLAGAGNAPFEVTVLDSKGFPVAFTKQITSSGHKITYIPVIPGPHTISVLYGGIDAPGTPIYQQITNDFVPTAHGEGLISGVVGKVATFVVDTNNNPGDLDVRIQGPNTIAAVKLEEDKGNKVYRVSYTPIEAGPYSIKINWNGKEINGSPFAPMVTSPSKEEPTKPPPSCAAVVVGEGMISMGRDKRAEFVVDGVTSGEPIVDCRGPTGQVRVATIRETGSRFKCVFYPPVKGTYTIAVLVGGIPACGSPFVVNVADDCYDDPPPMIPVIKHITTIKGDPGDPPSMAPIASGPGLYNAVTNQPAEFSLYSTSADPEISMSSAECDIFVQCLKVSDNKYRCTYTANRPGLYLLTIVSGGQLVDGSPFRVNITSDDLGAKTTQGSYPTVVDPPKNSAPVPRNVRAIGSGLTSAVSNKASDFMVDASNAGTGRLEAHLMGITNTIDVTCKSAGDGKYNCSYIPKVQGAYLLNVTWADQPIPGSPFKVTVLSSGEPGRVLVSGEALQSGGSVGSPIYFTVDATQAGKGELKATCQGPNNFVNCKIEEVTSGRYNVSFVPQEAGAYILQIFYNNALVPGFPATIRVNGNLDASKVVVSGEGLRDGVLAKFNSSFTIETRGGGPGQLNVRMRGKKDAFKIEMKRDPGDPRKIYCKYNPTEIGLYVLEIKWSGQHVPGSPFKIHIFDTLQELNQIKISGGSDECYGFGSDFYGQGSRGSLGTNGGYSFCMYD